MCGWMCVCTYNYNITNGSGKRPKQNSFLMLMPNSTPKAFGQVPKKQRNRSSCDTSKMLTLNRGTVHDKATLIRCQVAERM